MSEQKTCPGCGAKNDTPSLWHYECGSFGGRDGYPFNETMECLERQLAQRDERNAVLEARIKELTRLAQSPPSEVCRETHVQDCFHCEDMGCGDNLSPGKERIVALEARVKELEADFVAVAPVVLAAAMQVEARDAWTALIDSAASAAYYDACEATEGAVRALPADLLERMGVDRG